jgi:hypothetical protein
MDTSENNPERELRNPNVLTLEDYEWGMLYKLLPYEIVLQKEFKLRLRQSGGDAANYAREYDARLHQWKITTEGFNLEISYRSNENRNISRVHFFNPAGIIMDRGDEEMGYAVSAKNIP